MKCLIRKTIGIALAVCLVICAAVSHAKIDPGTAVGIWLFDEGKGKTVADLSGRGIHRYVLDAPHCCRRE